MKPTPQTDAFDGIFDDQDRGVREKVRNGTVVAFVRRNCVDSPAAQQFGMGGPFGSYPARQAPNLNTEPAESGKNQE